MSDGSVFDGSVSDASGPREDARVRVLTRPGCHLCVEAVQVIAAVCAELGAGWTEQDITGDPVLEPRYTDQVPVTFVDGAQHDFWRVSPQRLRRALNNGPVPGG